MSMDECFLVAMFFTDSVLYFQNDSKRVLNVKDFGLFPTKNLEQVFGFRKRGYNSVSCNHLKKRRRFIRHKNQCNLCPV